MPNSFEIVVDSNAVAKRCLVLFVVGASAFLGTATLLTQACCAVGYPKRNDQRASVPLLTDDSQIGANLRVCADEENRADWDQRG
jgi:hypothetical protein